MRAIALLTPEAMPGVARARVGEHGRGQRRDDQREPDGEEEQRRAAAPSSSRTAAERREIQSSAAAQTSGPMPMKRRGPNRIESRPTAARERGT